MAAALFLGGRSNFTQSGPGALGQGLTRGVPSPHLVPCPLFCFVLLFSLLVDATVRWVGPHLCAFSIVVIAHPRARPILLHQLLAVVLSLSTAMLIAVSWPVPVVVAASFPVVRRPPSFVVRFVAGRSLVPAAEP